MKQARLAALIGEILEKKLSGNFPAGAAGPSVGYSPLEKIRGGLFHWVAVPFNGIDVFCQLRCPNATQIEQCGDISNITLDAQDGKSCEYEDIITIRNYQEELCRLAFNRPTYDEIATLVGDGDFVISQKKRELEEISKRFEEGKGQMSETEREIIAAKIRTIEFQIGYILPDDTMAFVTKWAMGNDVSDIKKISKENFLRAAALARAHGKAPSDYLSGVFTDFNKHEIDSYAAMVYDDFLKEQQAAKGGGFHWFLGGRKRTAGTITGGLSGRRT